MENKNLEPKRNRLEYGSDTAVWKCEHVESALFFEAAKTEHFLISSDLSLIKKDISPG